MNKIFIRVWQETDLDEIKQRLLIVGDLTGDCSQCRQIGIDYPTSITCPKCQTAFKYLASRSKEASFGHIKRIKEKRPDLIFIDYNDFKNAIDRQKAKEFFKPR